MVTLQGFPNKTLPELELTLFDKINQHAAAAPNRFCTHLLTTKNHQLTEQGITYRDLIQQTLKLSAALATKAALNARIIIAIEHPIYFLIAFLAILAAKQIAVPVPSVGNFKTSKITTKRILSIYQDCEASLLLVDNAISWKKAGFTDEQLITINDIDFTHSENNNISEMLPKVELDAIAYLQYTSGSTGNPKGCIITHRNIVANVLSMGIAAEYVEQDILISWLPLYHDMGLISGLLSPLYWNGQHYLTTPRQFIGSPLIWLHAITKYKGTIIISPPFGYHLVSNFAKHKQPMGIDLASVRLAYIGAEPIPVKTIEQFINCFRDYGFKATSFYPCYGMAECTLAATAPIPNSKLVIDILDRDKLINHSKVTTAIDNDNSISFISVGHALPGHEILIINTDTGNLCAEREIGEIVVKGPSVTSGYFNKEPMENNSVKTGDLGYIANDQLFIIDRIKDIIIIAGQKFYPSDIEASLMELDELENARIFCFTVPNDLGTETLNIVIETKKDNLQLPLDNITTIIQQKIYNYYNIGNIKVLFVPRGAIQRTSSGKIMRNLYYNTQALSQLQELGSSYFSDIG